MTDKKLHTEADRANARDLFAPAFWRSFAALSLVLSVSSFMNVSVFPFFDGVFTYARDISITANAAVLIAIGLLATFRPALLHVRALNAGALALMAAGCALPLALGLGSASLLVLASCALAVGRAWCVLTAGIAASRLSSAQAGVLVPLAFVVQGVTSAFAWLLPVWAGMAIFLAAPFAAWALSWRDARPVLEQTQAGEAPHDFSVTRPSSFLLLASQLFVCLFLFRVAFGCSLRFGEVGGAPLSSFFVILPVAMVAVWALLSEKRFPADLLVQVSVLLIVAGFLAMTMDLPHSSTATVLLLSTGNMLFDMVAWAVLIAVAARNSRGAVAAFAWGRGVSSLGSTLGATLGVRANALAGMGTPLFNLFAAALILLFVGYALIGLRRFSFREVIDGVTPVETAVVEAPKATFDERCRALASQYSLTPRELEVFQMLARPRPRLHPGAAGGIAQHGESPRQAYIREAGHPLAPRPDRPGGEGVGCCSPKGEGDARMKLVGLISDTHGRLPDAALGALAYCNHIIHAGDICDPGILRELQIMAPTTAVLGNNDYDEYGKSVTRFAHPVIDGVRFLVAHYPNDARIGFNGSRAIAPGDPLPQVCVHGHTHIPEILAGRDAYPASLFICPGSCSRPRGGFPASVGFIELEAGRVRAARVESLDGEVLLEMGA